MAKVIYHSSQSSGLRFPLEFGSLYRGRVERPAQPRLTKGGQPYLKISYVVTRSRPYLETNKPAVPLALSLSLALTFGQSEKLSPQEQLALAFGLENLKPPPIILSE